METLFLRKCRMSLMKKLILVLLVCLPATAWSANLNYVLDVKIDPTEKKIRGIARLKADVSKKIGLSVRNLRKLKVDGKSVTAPADEGITLVVKSGKETLISYEALYVDRGINFIDNNNVFLTGVWYPQPDVLAEYELSVTLPKDFLATSEAEGVRIQNQGDKKAFHFQFKHPLDALHLAASTRYVLKKGRYKNITIEAFFFKEDAHLVDTYIAHAQKYLEMYETMLTPYPYKRFAVVENILPTGNSMPTYTLLGNRVVRLPFIVKTSLGHEILHQWFGNSVYIDFAHGNWAEGITTYLADHHYAALEGKDAAYRKQIMVKYSAYVNKSNAIRVSDFYSRRNRAQSAIGYGKSAMLFHWLRKRYGDITFFAALRDFIQQNKFRKASWHDLQRAFEKVTGEKLYKDFGDWLTRKDIPRFSVEDAELQVEKGQLKLNFTLFKQGPAYRLRIPVTIYTERGEIKRVVEVNDIKENISLTLDEPPTRVVIDQDYSLMRQLTPEETPPVLASIMGKEKVTAVVTDERRALYQPIIDSLGVKNIIYGTPDTITFSEMRGNTLLIAGYDNSLVGMLFGKQVVPEAGVYVKVYKNPYNIAERIMLLHVKNLAEAQDVQRKIPHYGKYTELAFNHGRNIHTAIVETDNGISVLTRPATRALRPDKIATLSEILPKLSESRIIYVGERHDRFAHHFNQLQIIKKLHESGHKLAVGMEMFQRTQQQTLDDYLAGRIDEPTFLEKSEYYDKWGYDYNLYKPIIDYIKQKRIPLVALNIERAITRKVSREGMHSLTDEEKKRIPSELDFSNKEYRDDLNKVFSLHADHGEFRDFNYFLQSQTLWDEGMAESAHQFMARNSEFKMVILTGNGHIRHKYGIPERLYRRNQEPFTVVVQDEEIEHGIADYVLLSTELKGRESPKLGVLVQEKDQGLVVVGIRDNTPAMKAGLQKGDIIIQFAGQPIGSLADLKRVLFFSEMGSTLEIRLKRKDKTLDKEIQLFDFERSSP
jgi:uncharacterized iron-regulated protein